MANCIYIYKGHTFKNEVELDDFLLNKGDSLYTSYGDLVFQSMKSAATCLKLKGISLETKKVQLLYLEAKKLAKYIDGEEDIKLKPPYIGVTSFLKGLRNKDNNLLSPEFDEKEYWVRRVNAWKTSGFDEEEQELFGENITITDNVSNKEIIEYLERYEKGETNTLNLTLLLIKLVKEKWQALGEIGSSIHEVLKILFTKNLNKSSKYYGKLKLEYDRQTLLNLVFKQVPPKLTKQHVEQIIDYAILLKNQLETTLGDNDLQFFPEFAITSKLALNIGGDTVLGIIDLLVIDSLGNAHIIDYKASPRNRFDSAKERSFWYLLGMYNRILSNNGIYSDSKTPKVMIAPIKMGNFRREELDFTLDSIEARDPEYLMDVTSNATLGRVSENLDEFIPEKSMVNLPPEEVIKLQTKFSAEALPSISTSKSWTDDLIIEFIKKNKGYDINPKTNKMEITLGGKTIKADTEKEIFDRTKEYFTILLPKRRKDTVTALITSLRKGILEETSEIELPRIGLINSKEGASRTWFKNIIGKYCNKNYEIIENDTLQAYGIILIRNLITNLYDVLNITTDNLDFLHLFSNSPNRKLLTGAHTLDTVESRKTDSLALLATNGNIHLMETMAVLNCFPELIKGEGVIGQVLVANPHTLLGVSASNKEILYNFNELSKYVKDYQNNIKNFKFASKTLLAINKLNEILSLGEESGWRDTRYSKFKLFQSLSNELVDLTSKNTLRKLEKFRKDLEKEFPIDTGGTPELEVSELDDIKVLYAKVALAIAELSGIDFRLQTSDNSNIMESKNIFQNGVQSLLMDNPGNLNNDTLNLLTKLATLAYLNVREDTLRESSKIRELVNNLKADKNFGKIRELTSGNLASLYSRMTEFRDGDFYFIDPWRSNSLSSAEREFLEYVVLKVNKNRYPQYDEETIKSGNDRFLKVPLAKGDFSSLVAISGSLFKSLKTKLKRLLPKVWWLDMQNSLTGLFTDLENIKDNSKLFEMSNMFELGEDGEMRQEVILEHGLEYFESNLETLLLKHTFAYSMLNHINSIMPMAKASMIHLITLGHLSNKKFTNSTNYVSDYIKSKIKNESITDPNWRSVEASIGLIRLAASFLALAFSPISYGGLIILGFWTDIRLMFQNAADQETPFTFENFRFACKEVYKDMFKLGGKPTKCSLLNEYYGINDMDTNTYIDKIKSDRYGLFNFTNLAFHSVSRPDFFNRMSILVSLMKKDGVWDAYSVNSKQLLVYDWKKDSRFSAYASGNTTDPKYKELKGLYYTIAELLEREHALNSDGSAFKIGDSLPKAYTNLLMESYKSFSDDIYGYYSHEKRAMIHSLTAGALWMQMRTFWSGKKNLYLGAPGTRLKGAYVLLRNEEGLLLWLKEEDGKLIPTTENTGVPCIRWEGLWQEGILLTLARLFYDRRENGFKTTFDDMWNNPDERLRNLYRANIKLLCYDFMMFAIVGPIAVGIMSDWDDELKKEALASADMGDASVATAAHVLMKMVSYSFGDFNFIESIGTPLTSWQPFSFNYLSRRLSDIWDTAIGDKSFSNTLLNMSGFTSNTKTFWKVLLEQ